MEARRITVVSTQTQRKSVITTGAETLAELKSALDEAGINYDGMTFYEGTSRTELKDNASVLPKDVPYKGTTTNELVFMLTNTNKKIRSGNMSRAEAYAAIKANNLQDAVKSKFGKNFTQCSTEDLIGMLAKSVETKPAAKKETKAETKAEKPVEVVDKVARKAISELVDALYSNDSLDSEDADNIRNILDNTGYKEDEDSKDASSYSDDDIDNMFDFLHK
jgi:predicted nucleic acid-binding Zn ribbon protein